MKHTHRALYHDYKTVLLVESLLGEDLALEALLHIIVDLESVRSEDVRVVKLPGQLAAKRHSNRAACIPIVPSGGES